MSAEIHDFIIWQNAKDMQNEIISILEKKFKILKAFEVHWNKENFALNLSRLYGQNLNNVEYKMDRCGTGPFLLIVILDENPNYSERNTLKGKAIVNANVFDSKSEFRKLTGGEQRVHGSNSQKEAINDISLILGKNQNFSKDDIWNKKFDKIDYDLPGTKGWNSLAEFFSVINNCVQYVVFRSYEGLPRNFKTGEEGDIDLLVEDFEKMVSLSNGQKISGGHETHQSVAIGDKKVAFDFLYVGDNYIDPKWASNILKNKRLDDRGFYVPNSEDYFFTLLYHGLVHKTNLPQDYKKRLLKISQESNLDLVNETTINDKNVLEKILDEFLNNNNYFYVKPRDPKVFYNYDFVKNKKNLRHDQKPSLLEKNEGYFKAKRLAKSSIQMAKSEGIGEVFKAAKRRAKKKIKDKFNYS